MNYNLIIRRYHGLTKIPVKEEEKMKPYKLSGNEIKILLFDYVVKKRVQNDTMPESPVVLRSILTSDMVGEIANEYGIGIITVTPKIMLALHRSKSEVIKDCIFSFSKDTPCLKEGEEADRNMLEEMEREYKSKNITLESVLENMYEKYGYYKEGFVKFDCKDEEEIANHMTMIKEYMPHTVGGYEVLGKTNYTGRKEEDAEKEHDILEYSLNNNVRMIITSGDQKTIEIYIFARGYSEDFVTYSINNLKKYLRLELDF